ncbi:MAG: hypothetical protein IIB38_01675 [Candidatus Hydrogenedentes bacterium]|nr:hypothetical protein [Candidatus Hydrogenedentota bacterium]
MKRILPYAGWGIALVVLAGFLFQYVVNREQTAEIDLLSGERAALTALVGIQAEKLEAYAADMDAVTQRMKDTEATVLIWQDYLTDTFSGTDPANLPDEIAELLPDALKEVEKSSFDFSNFEMPEHMSGYMGTMMTEMQYGDFISSLDVSPETREEVRNLIMGTLKETFDTVYEGDAEPFAESTMFSNAELRTELETILTPEQLAEFDAYEENLSEHMMRQSTNMQLQMLAGGLTEENRELVTEILVEEFSAAFDDIDEESFDPLSFGGMNEATYESARQRLSELLAPDQLAIYDRYVDMQNTMMESMSEMMEMMNTEE